MLRLTPFFYSIQYALDLLHYKGIFKSKTISGFGFCSTRCDKIAVLPTGYGKSILFHLLPFVCDQLKIPNHCSSNNAVLVISPLILKKSSVEASVVDISLLNDKQLRRNSNEGEDDDQELYNQVQVAIVRNQNKT